MQRKDFTNKVWVTSNVAFTQDTLYRSHNEPNDKACVSRRTNSDQNMCKWISQVPQVSRHCRIRRRIHEQIVDKKFVATNVSVRLLGIKRRSEGMAMSSHEETSLWNGQEDGMMKGEGGGRQRLKHVVGDVPMCMRNKDEEWESALYKIEKVKGRGGGRQGF